MLHVFPYLLLAGPFNLRYNVAKFGDNSSRLSLRSFEILFINFLRLNFHLQQQNWYNSPVDSYYTHWHVLEKRLDSDLLLHGFNLGTESLAAFPGPSGCKLWSQ